MSVSKDASVSAPAGARPVGQAPPAARASPTGPVLAAGVATTLLLLVFGLAGERSYFVFPPGTYVTFHVIVEVFAILVALSIFGVGWFTHDQSQDRHALLLACVFLAIGLGDFVHTLSYPGMPPLLGPNSANKASQVWIAVRLLGALAFLAAAWVPSVGGPRGLRRPVLLAGALLVALGFLLVAGATDALPAAFVPGLGQTALKRAAEFAVVAVTLGAAVAYVRRQARTGERYLALLASGLVVCGLGEIPFAFYLTATDSLNALGHVLKVAGFSLVYRGLFIASVQEPYRREADGRQALALESAGRAAAEAQLRQSQKLEAVGRLAGGVAHDFNNLLTAILGGADALAGSLPPGDRRGADVEDIREAAGRAAVLTRQLLTFSRKQVVAPRTLDLNEVVLGLQRLLGRTIGGDVELEVRAGPGRLPVHADRGQLEQVLVNLAVNARDAMPEGGRLVIATSAQDGAAAGSDALAGEAAGPQAVLEVRDTGCGMGPDVQAHLFEPFFTTKAPGQGTGLGLSTVYGIVQEAGGTIEVRSAPGAGATFRVMLPLRDRAPVEPVAAVRAAPARGSETVLVVEDHPLVLGVAVRTLEGQGYRVLQAADGEAALQWVGRPGERVDLLLSDVNMPHLGGVELAARVRREVPGLRLLLMSGFEEREGGLRRGLLADVGLLRKPFTPDELLDRVRQALDAPAPASPGASAADRS